MGGGTVRAVLLLVLLLTSATAFADGMYIGKTYTAKPSIPDQRAVLVWHEGVETLLVESKLRAEAGEYSWVVPLPSVPIEVAKARPSVMDLSFDRFDPVVTRPDASSRWAAMFILGAVLLSSLLSFAVRRVTSRVVQVLILTIGTALGFVFYPVFAPSLDYLPRAAGIMNGADHDPVQVVSRKTVGSYDVSVIRSDQASALVDWLDKEGTPLPPQAEPVVKSYLDEGWCFVAAKLRKSEAEDLMPHPLRIRFKTEEPVYPMRLTGLVSDRLELDLLVIGQQEAKCSSLDVWRSMPVSYSSHAMPLDPAHYRLSKGAEIRHVDLAPYLPGNAVGTRLRRTLTASEMKRDFRFAWQPISDPQPKFETEKGLEYLQHARGLAALAGLVFVGTFLSIVTRWKSVVGHLFSVLGVVLLSLGVAYGSTRDIVTIELADPGDPKKSDLGSVLESVQYALKKSRAPGFDPFPVRFERALASRRAYNSGLHVGPDPQPGPQNFAAVREWNRDEIFGYQLRKLRENEYEVQVMNAWGEIARHNIRDRAPTKDDLIVETTIRVVAWPREYRDTALRAGILPNWQFKSAQFVRSDGKTYYARHIGNGQFRGLLPAGEFRVMVPLLATESEELTWSGKRTLTIPLQRSFAAEGRLDLTKFFAKPH